MSADVWYKRPNFEQPFVQFDWQDSFCKEQTLASDWDKDVGVWEIVAIRLHKKGEYQAPWKTTSVKIDVLPNDQLQPEFERRAKREAEVQRMALRLMACGALFLLSCLALAVFIGSRMPRKGQRGRGAKGHVREPMADGEKEPPFAP
jgi:hypothetical protein